MSYIDPNPLTVASFAERLSRQKGQVGNVFAIVTLVSLGLVAYNEWEEIMKRHNRERER